MIGFSIMMWFAAIILLIVSITILRGNLSFIHGRIFELTEDKAGYGKATGKLTLVMSIGMAVSGIFALFGSNERGFKYALFVLAVVIVIAVIGFIRIQRRFSGK